MPSTVLALKFSLSIQIILTSIALDDHYYHLEKISNCEFAIVVVVINALGSKSECIQSGFWIVFKDFKWITVNNSKHSDNSH